MGKVRLCLKEMCFLLLFCCQDVSRSLPSNLLLILSFNLFGFSRGPLTAADLFNDVREKSTRSPIAVPTAQSSICHDLYIVRASKTDKCVFLWVRTSARACARDPPTSTPLLSLQPTYPTFPPSPCYGRNTHIRLKVYTLISSTKPTPSSLTCWFLFPPLFLHELHAPAGGHLRELEGSQSSRGHHTDSCHSDRDR